MEEIVAVCLAASCLIVPLGLLVYIGSVYALGVGSVRIPGIARGVPREGKEWSSVSDFSRKAGEGVGAVVSAMGAAFGLFGFLLPWVQLNVSAGLGILDLGGLNGTLTGIAFVVQSFVVGVGLLSVNVQGAAALGAILLLMAVSVGLIPLALLAVMAISTGMLAGPLGLLKTNLRRLSGPLLIVSLVALCMSCSFFALIQGTVGGLEVGAGDSLFGSAFNLGISVAAGFWVTIGGLLLAMIGALWARTVAPRVEGWSSRLASLERDEGNGA